VHVRILIAKAGIKEQNDDVGLAVSHEGLGDECEVETMLVVVSLAAASIEALDVRAIAR
jgi:hypothetical protein